MVERSVRRAKLFFILSDDFGELANALYLIHGQEFDPALLMPARLFALHQGRLAVRAGAYATVADVLAAVDRELPDIAFLFSGYLYVVNRILSAEGLETLIQGLCARDCRIAVSDPFLGLMGKRDGDTFADHPQKRLLIDIFDRVFAVLKPFPHLYLAELNEPTETSNVAFFNPQILVPPATRARLEQAIRHNLGIDPARRRWLFLLSHEEYGAQMMRYGRERFAELLANLLRQTIREGRQPILVAPPACFAALGGRVAGLGGFIPLTFCPHDLFSALIHEAEYAFYWNIFSNSLLARVVNRLPVFFFDQGHMVRAIRPFLNVGMRSYYRDAELPYLNPAQPLAAPHLAERAAWQEQSLRDAVHALQQLPTPAAMIESLLRQPIPGAGE